MKIQHGGTETQRRTAGKPIRKRLVAILKKAVVFSVPRVSVVNLFFLGWNLFQRVRLLKLLR